MGRLRADAGAVEIVAVADEGGLKRACGFAACRSAD